MSAEAPFDRPMTAEEFFAWAETWGEGERNELGNGHPIRLQSERASHAGIKLSAVIALRSGLRVAGLDECCASTHGVGVRIDDRRVREPDAIVHCGPCDGDKVFAPNPFAMVGVIFASSVRTDVDRELIDYFGVRSILHYLVPSGDESRVVCHSRLSADALIATAIPGREAAIDLRPLRWNVTVEALLES